MEQWEYLMVKIVPWLDGWEYRPLDDKGNAMEPEEWKTFGILGTDVLNTPGLNDIGAKGWEVVGVIPETHIYADDGNSLHSTKTVLLLKRRKA